jgi:hypothetical protein
MTTQVKQHRRISFIYSIGAFIAAIVFVLYLMVVGP